MTELSRRGFLETSTAAGLALAAPGLLRCAANERLNVAILGPGGRGRALLKNFFGVCKEHNAELVRRLRPLAAQPRAARPTSSRKRPARSRSNSPRSTTCWP